jgi:hypothetical protein
MQHINRSAREQRRIDFERRVFGRRADKGQQPAFDIGQESVLLRLVEAMYFVDEEDRPPSTAGARHFSTCHRLTNVLDPREDRRDGDEVGSKGVRHQARQRRLADSGRPPEDHAVQLPGLESHGQRLAGTEQMRLPDHLGQRPSVAGARPGEHLHDCQLKSRPFPSLVTTIAWHCDIAHRCHVLVAGIV